jgi:hypothetical protein
MVQHAPARYPLPVPLLITVSIFLTHLTPNAKFLEYTKKSSALYASNELFFDLNKRSSVISHQWVHVPDFQMQNLLTVKLILVRILTYMATDMIDLFVVCITSPARSSSFPAQSLIYWV